MKCTVLTIIALLGIISNVGVAQGANDEENYEGDNLSFPVNIKGTYKTFGSTTTTTVCIPANTDLQALGNSVDNLGVVVYLLEPGLLEDPVIKSCGGTGGETIPVGVAITILKTDVKRNVPSRFGLTYGVLVVPYKYNFEGSENFEGNSTVGPFLGYRFDKTGYGFGVKAIAFIGGAAIKVDRTDENGDNNDETVAGFSYGVGLIGEVKNEFQLGIVFGQDKVSSGSDYEDNGKWWGAVALGFSFAN